MCAHISTAGKDSLKLIEEMLDSSKAVFGQNMNLSSFVYADLLKKVVETNSLIAKRKNQKIELLVETDCEIKADSGKLTEIIDNLINNAIKYSEKGQQIEVRLWEKEDEVILEVKDRGQGFTPRDKKQLFGRFSKLSAQPTDGENSTGLGLFIVKELVNAHQGSIYAKSEGEGKGAVFTVKLPKEQAGGKT